MCGALVIDDEGEVFGHIIAGDPATNVSFIIPEYKVFNNLRTRFTSATFAPSESTTAQNAVDDSKEIDDTVGLYDVKNRDMVSILALFPPFWRSLPDRCLLSTTPIPW